MFIYVHAYVIMCKICACPPAHIVTHGSMQAPLILSQKNHRAAGEFDSITPCFCISNIFRRAVEASDLGIFLSGLDQTNSFPHSRPNRHHFGDHSRNWYPQPLILGTTAGVPQVVPPGHIGSST